MSIQDLRAKIDTIDEELVRLFCRRMAVAEEIAAYKKEQDLPIFVPQREREKLKEVARSAGEDMAEYTRVLYSMIFELSRSHQGKLNRSATPLYGRIANAVEHTAKLLPKAPTVACQGVEGAYSQIACEKLFKDPFILYFKNFEGVFSAIEKGLCRYGILPIENSTAGSVNAVYDLMIRHNFSIVRTFRMKINHDLLVNPGTKLQDIRQILSHQQAISQCSSFLAGLPNVEVIAVENTAVAAKLVAESGRRDIAALSSRSCAELYGLEALQTSVQDEGNNHTRFICISKDLEVYPGADRTSIMMILPHKPGALYKVLARMYVLGINVVKLESRPLPERDFEFMFYFDLETSVYSEEFLQLMCELEELCEEFKYLGSYSEVV